MSKTKPPKNRKPRRADRGKSRLNGQRGIDMLLAGSGEAQPQHFLKGRSPDARKLTFAEALGKEMPAIPSRLPNGVEIDLTLKQRKILAMVLQGSTTSEIGRAVGMTIPAVRNLLAGRTSAHVREAFRLLLEGSGIDAVAIVAKTHELLSATRAQWNPSAERWDMFPDYSTQLGTWRPLIQLLGFMPARAQSALGAAPSVVINTNFGGDKKAPEAEGKFQITVRGKLPPRDPNDRDYNPDEEAGPIVDVDPT